MDDVTEHYFTAVGDLLNQAAVGNLRVNLTLAGGALVTGVPDRGRDASSVQLNDTGHPQHITIDGQTIALSTVRRAAILHPEAD